MAHSKSESLFLRQIACTTRILVEASATRGGVDPPVVHFPDRERSE
jgi:hypothetical protein